MTTPTLRSGRDLSKIALQVATEASRLVLAGFRQNPTVAYKAHEEPYTEFDVQSEQLIRQRLAELTGTRGGEWHRLTAGAFVSMIVPLLVFFGLQRYFVRGLLAGGLKG